MGNPFRRALPAKPLAGLTFAAEAAATLDQVATALVDVPAEVLGFSSYAADHLEAPLAPVSARQAMQVPAFRHGTDLVCTLSTLPLAVVRSDYTVEATSWLQQPERDVPRSVTMARLVKDLAHYGIAWWKVTAYDWRGFPAYVARLDPRTVDVLPDARVKVTTAGRRGMAVEWPADAELIRFEMPGGGWLADGARAIRQCLILDAAAQRYAEGAPPGDYFEPADPSVDPFEDESEVRTKLLDPWGEARRRSSTAYVPAGLKYVGNAINPEQLELADQRQHAVLELARLMGIDAEEVGVSTTSRTYANTFDRRKQFTDFTLGQFRAAIEDRLSMADVTPRGSVVRFDLDGFLRSDPLARFQAYKAGLEVGAIADKAEVRALESKPALSPDQAKPIPAPAPAAPAEPAAPAPAQPDPSLQETS